MTKIRTTGDLHFQLVLMVLLNAS